jgi:alkylation response protein AidB-like acyl-CoA dehydrogenase
VGARSEAAAGGSTLDEIVGTIAARAGEHDRDATFPHEAFDLLHSAGVLNLTVPSALGGTGAGLAESCHVVEAVAMGDASVALVLSQHLMYHAYLASPAACWPAEVHERVQRSSIEGVALINALRVEPELGSPARGGLPATTAERLPNGDWRLRGRKIYATGIPRLRWLAVWARTDDAEPLVGTFLVPRYTAGIDVVETWDHLGMRATRSDDVVFDGAVIPADHAVDIRLPSDHAGSYSVAQLAWNGLILSALYQGVARAARDWLSLYLHQRIPTNLGAPLATLPRFQEALGRIEARLLTNDRLIDGAAREVDAGGDAARAAADTSSIVKHTVTTNAIDSVSEAVALIGNPGLSRHNPLERHLRDVLCSRIHSPQDDTILVGAGRAALARATYAQPGEPNAR